MLAMRLHSRLSPGLLGALVTAATCAASAGATAPASSTARVAFVHAGDLFVLDLTTGVRRVVLRHAGAGPVHWSGDGRLVSSGGRIAGGPALPTHELVWAPSGETAAYLTHNAGVVVWTPHGQRRIAAEGWGATALAWSTDGRLAIGRALYRPRPHAQAIWVWDGRRLRRLFALGVGGPEPYPVAWQAGRVVWWAYPDSASLAADGVSLYADRTRIGETLMYPDYVVRCGAGLALADGGDRYSTHGKRIVLDGRDLSRDPARSWVSPACSAAGRTLVAAAGHNWVEDRFGHEHRAIWQLLPKRRQLTHPPAGFTDESPTVLADGSILFVRTSQSSRKRNGQWYVTMHAELERLANGKLSAVANVGYTAGELSPLGDINYYGHYGWPSLIATTT
jgi:hypothetical protein